MLRDDKGKNEFEIEGYVFQRISKFEIIKSNLDYSQFIHVLFPEIQIVRNWYISVRLYSDGKNAIGDESYFYVANSKIVQHTLIWKVIASNLRESETF